LRCLLETIGEQGTILVPTYTFSFCRREIFDIEKSEFQGGPWTTSVEFIEFFRRLPGVVRSRDPIYSVAGIGRRAKELLADLPNTCFGEGSIHHRLLQTGGKICLIGAGIQAATFPNHIEEMAAVPFCFKKLFTGYIRESSALKKTGWIQNVHLQAQNGQPDRQKLETLCRSSGKCQSISVGSGEIMCISATELAKLLSAALSKDPWFTAQGPAGNPIELEQARVAGPHLTVNLPADASMSEMIEAIWKLPRDIVSDGYDAALRALAEQLPMTVHEYPTGTECWSWILPEKWICYEAYLATLDGRRLFSYADNPLHAVSYSLPFDGEVSRRELFEHLHVHHKIPEAIPFIFKYYERDWGLCCSKKLKDTLHDERYRVVIKSAFSFGHLKVGEVVVPGKTEESIVLCAHLCHPAMVNDDLAGVVVGMKVMQELLKRENLHYTYRFLIVPETIGSVAYLSQSEKLIPKMKGGFFLEMLGLDNPHALQLSFAGNTEMDLCCTLALHDHDPFGWTGAFRTIIGNDERQYNAPGVRVPLLSLSRVLPPSEADWPYREYHSSHDTPETVSTQRLEKSVALVLEMVDTIEDNQIPFNLYKGEIFCSRYGLFIDPYENPEGSSSLFNIMDAIDGTKSVAEIARACTISFRATRKTIDELLRHGLVEYRGRGTSTPSLPAGGLGR
jgi:aminopeptidase-like protein/aminoglycoside N3'-acetyltransferase